MNPVDEGKAIPERKMSTRAPKSTRISSKESIHTDEEDEEVGRRGKMLESSSDMRIFRMTTNKMRTMPMSCSTRRRKRRLPTPTTITSAAMTTTDCTVETIRTISSISRARKHRRRNHRSSVRAAERLRNENEVSIVQPSRMFLGRCSCALDACSFQIHRERHSAAGRSRKSQMFPPQKMTISLLPLNLHQRPNKLLINLLQNHRFANARPKEPSSANRSRFVD